VKRDFPDFEAVKRSPMPDWSTKNDANEVDPDREAMGRIPLCGFARNPFEKV
jgi:hypothetical protein